MNGVQSLKLRRQRKRQGLCPCGRAKDKDQYYCQKCRDYNMAYQQKKGFSCIIGEKISEKVVKIC